LDLPENNWIKALRNGDERVFETIFRSYYERLCAYANTILKDPDEAEEMVQQTFTVLWEKRETIEVQSSVKAYLYKAVYNSSLNRIKHQKVKQAHREYYEYQGEELDYSPDNQMVGKELQLQINQAVEQMPDQCRKVFELSRFENLTYAEIAEQMNLSIKTVEKHKMKALQILRENLKDYLPLLLFLIYHKN
jgi:RNA polymerase sigma-70 factor (ECF subfamily)